MSTARAKKSPDPILLEETLKYLGVRERECSFEMLKECARGLDRNSPPRQARRWYDGVIRKMVKDGDSLIDLGCGDGTLMASLVAGKTDIRIQGVEKNEVAVNRCIERGLPVCHADLCEILPALPTHSYTWAVLGNTLQTLERPLDTLDEMLRIAEKSVIAFPNFAHWWMRFTFSLGGRMPVTKAFPYTWHDTPNIHNCSITDFQDVIRSKRLQLLEAWVLCEGKIERFNSATDQNILAEQALFVVSRS